jgi:hypothetical protein
MAIAVQRVVYNGSELQVPFAPGKTDANDFMKFVTYDSLWFERPDCLALFSEDGIELDHFDQLPGGDSLLTLRPRIVKA